MSAIVSPQPAKSTACLLTYATIGMLAASNASAANSADTFVQSNNDRTHAMLNDGALSASGNS